MLLDAHPEIAVAPRMPWLTTMPGDREAVGPDGTVLPGIARRIAEAHAARAQVRPPAGFDQLGAMLASEAEMPYPEFVAALFDAHATRRGKPLAVVDAVGMAHELAALAALWPQTRIVHVIGDGRNVALEDIGARRAAGGAVRPGTWAQDPVARSALRWEHDVRSARATGALLGPERYREVRADELAGDLEYAFASVCAFLGVRYDERTTRDRTAGRLARPQDGSGAPGAVRTALAPDELARWEAVAGDLLDELGYARRARAPSAADLAGAAELRAASEAVPLPAQPAAVGTGRTVWLTGLSGAGKSTVARLVERRLRERGVNVEVLDGDAIRRNLSQGLGFSREDRDTNIRRIAYVADLLSRNGVTVIVAAISPYRSVRDEARALMGGRFIEVHVHASVNVCAARDVKGLYAKALAGQIANFTGVSDPYEPPTRPELVLDTEHEAPETTAGRLLAHLETRTLP